METAQESKSLVGLRYIVGASLFLYILGLALTFLYRIPDPRYLFIYQLEDANMWTYFYSEIIIYYVLMIIMLTFAGLWLKDHLSKSGVKLMVAFSTISMLMVGVYSFMLLHYPDVRLFVVYIPLIILMFVVGLYWMGRIGYELFSSKTCVDVVRTTQLLLVFLVALILIGLVPSFFLISLAPAVTPILFAFAIVTLIFYSLFREKMRIAESDVVQEANR